MAPHRKGLLNFEGVRIKPGSKLIAYLESLRDSRDCDENLRKKAEDFLKCDAAGAPFGSLRSLRDAVNSAGVGDAPVYLHKLLEGSELCFTESRDASARSPNSKPACRSSRLSS
ncbi:hypothetical protein MTO96_025808 [Rhipicephalus appendiculatus]